MYIYIYIYIYIYTYIYIYIYVYMYTYNLPPLRSRVERDLVTLTALRQGGMQGVVHMYAYNSRPCASAPRRPAPAPWRGPRTRSRSSAWPSGAARTRCSRRSSAWTAGPTRSSAKPRRATKEWQLVLRTPLHIKTLVFLLSMVVRTLVLF